MRWFSDPLFRLRAILTWRRMRRDLDDEVAFHLEMETRKYVGQGMSAVEARRRALRAFGGVERQKERTQDAWGVTLIHDLRADLSYAGRQLRRNPTFTAVAVLTLALGIGGTTAIFSVVNGVLLKPLRYEDPDRLVTLIHTLPGVGAAQVPMSPATYFTYREQSRAFEEVGLYKPATVTVTGLAEPQRLAVLLVTEGVFPLLGVRPVLGRGFTAEDVSPATALPVLLSYGWWQRAFGGARDVVGRTVRLNGTEREIIGVMPRGLRIGAEDPVLYLPLVIDRARVRVGNYSFPGIARLRRGVTVEAATRDVASLLPAAVAEFGGKTMAELESMGFGTIVQPLKASIVGDVGTVLWLLFGTVAVVLLIACANVANLFLVRAEHRRRELAMRTALGASRGRVTRQLLVESLVLGLLGGAVGLALAYGGLGLLRAIAPADLPRVEEIAIEPVALCFTLGVSALAGLLFGLAPMLRYRRPALTAELGDGRRGVGGGRDRRRLRNGFAVAQVALAFVLLVGSGLMIRSFDALLHVRPGFERPEEVLTLRLALPLADAREPEDAVRTHERIMDRIRQIPGVVSVSAGASVAMSAWDSWDDIAVEGQPTPEGQMPPHRRFNWIAPDYFTTLQSPVMAGRAITWDDIHQRRPVAMVSENLAREYWGDPAHAVGRRVSPDRDGPWWEIIGVAANEYTQGVAKAPPTVVYWPILMEDLWFPGRDLCYAIRVAGVAPTSLLPQVRQAVWSVNPNLPLYEVQTLQEIRAASMARTSFTLVMLGLAAAVALVLGAVGVFGVVSFLVSRRAREFGLRLAVGARTGDIARLVLREGARVGMIGVVLGLAAAFALTRLMSALLFGVSAADPSTFLAVAVGLLTVVVVASYVPAHRAARVDPAETLRWE